MSIILHNSDIIKISTAYDKDVGAYVVTIDNADPTSDVDALSMAISDFYALHFAIADAVSFIDRNCCFDEKPKG